MWVLHFTMEVAHQIHTRLRYLLCNCRAEILGSSGAQAGAGGYCGRDGARNDQSPSVSNDVQSYISLILQTRWHTQYTGHTHEDLVHLDTTILTFHLQPTNNPCKILSIILHCYTVGPVPQRLYVCFSEAQLGHFSEFNQEKSKMTDNVFFFSCRYGAHFRQKAEVDTKTCFWPRWRY